MSTLKKTTLKKTNKVKTTPVKNRKKYQKILLKLSGEALAGEAGYGIEPHILEYIADEVQEIHKLGIEIAIVLGGGNIFRGIKGATSGMDRATADYMGMLATVLNSLALQDALERKNVHTRVQAAISMQELAEPYIRRRAVRHLEKNRVVIFAAGTGNPYFTTDTTAALRAMEVGSDVVLKATKVDGIYSADPFKDHKAVKYSELTYLDVLQKGLKVMDSTAISLCMDNNLPIIVFNLNQKGALKKVVQGHALGTFVR